MGFRATDTSVYELPGTSGRFLHLGTIQSNLREYMCFLDCKMQKCYIEEITGGQLSFIQDDNLAFDLAKYCEEKGIIDMKKIFMLAQAWHKKR